ncbi:MAG: CinA family nicotinamide mononucleotide deamidase-related protein [Muribaculaceae bacterium]|nr:CinA family nicotinamide mononucleotide deamidase-related protein [Muribaculaceae bacterium]
MKVYIINIGDELLIGQVVNTLAADLAKMLDPHDIEVEMVEMIADDEAAITAAVERALASDCEVVLTTGGLGPTRDDITKKVMLGIFGGNMVEDEATLKNVGMIVERRGLKLNDLTRAQALVPSSCRVIQNSAGTAPIMWFERDGKVLISMPGVPFETLTMMREQIIDQLMERFPSDVAHQRRVMIVTGYTESALAQELADIEDTMPSFIHLAYLPRPGIVRLRLDGRHHDAELLEAEVTKVAKRIGERLGDAVKATDDLTEAQILLKVLGERNLTVGTAESCTGGNIAHQITLIPGSSASYMGSVVSYANRVKTSLLGVDEDTIAKNGVVSIPVVEQMASGVCRALGVDVGIATSGIAGPGGAVPGKPVGTVCIAVAVCGKVVSRLCHFPGSRDRVIDRATTTALVMAIDTITGASYDLHGYLSNRNETALPG